MLIRVFPATTVLGVCLAVSGCSKPAAAPVERHVLRMAATTAEDPNLKAAVSRLPDISIRPTTPGGASITSLVEMQHGKTDMGIALADVAYLAYTGQLGETPAPFTELRGMAMLDVNTFHVLVSPLSKITSIGQLKGRRIALGPTGTATALTAEMLLKAYGVDLEELHGEQVPYPEATERLVRGDFDAAFMTQIVGSTPVTDAVRGGARLLDLDGPLIEELRRQRPFLRRTLIPKDAYPGLTRSVRTLGVDRVMICRADVDEDVVFRLLDAYFATPPGATPRADLERAPATPLPLHPGAARYYRQRELSR